MESFRNTSSLDPSLNLTVTNAGVPQDTTLIFWKPFDAPQSISYPSQNDEKTVTLPPCTTEQVISVFSQVLTHEARKGAAAVKKVNRSKASLYCDGGDLFCVFAISAGNAVRYDLLFKWREPLASAIRSVPTARLSPRTPKVHRTTVRVNAGRLIKTDVPARSESVEVGGLDADQLSVVGAEHEPQLAGDGRLAGVLRRRGR
jgi:hypothetical protein